MTALSTDALTAFRAIFSVSVQVKVTVTTVWMRLKMEKDAGFWLTREITDVDVVVAAEQERARGEASREDLILGPFIPLC